MMKNSEIISLIILHSIKEKCTKYDIAKITLDKTDGYAYKTIDEWISKKILKKIENNSYIPNYEKIRFYLRVSKIMNTIIEIADKEDETLIKLTKK